ncbi:SHOCT domain-containing protein [Spirillospora sp. CA-253888]
MRQLDGTPLQQLGELRDAGLLTSEEFDGRKQELLSRL